MTSSRRAVAWILAWLTAVGVTAHPVGAQVQPHLDEVATVRWFETAYGTRGIDVTRAELEPLVRLWGEATDPEGPPAARRTALRELLERMVEIQDVPDWRYGDAGLQALVDRVDELQGLPAPPPPMASEPAAPGKPGSVEVVGSGPVPLVLISDVDYDGAVYRDFSEEYADAFTSYIVTLPGAGGTAPPPWTGRPGDTPWLDNAEAAVLSVLDAHRLQRPVVVGVMAGVYTAARIALEHPDRVRAAVLLHGLVSAPTASPIDPSSLATPAERRAWADATLPDLFPPPSPEANLAAYLAFQGVAGLDPDRAERLTRRAARTDPDAFARYVAELGATDLAAEIGALEVPTLVIPSIHDPGSPAGGTHFGTGQWQSLALDHPELPMEVVPFHSTRNYAPVDRPHALADAILHFLEDRPVRGVAPDPTRSAYQPSPAAEVAAVLGATEVRVSYHAPGVRGRSIWGDLVPWDQVWRAGANAATRIDVSRDVVVQGDLLPAGSYSFFVVPREEEPWTLIFNRVSIQSGSAFHEPRHDALRIDVPAEPAPHRERLQYTIEMQPPGAGRVVLHWADRQVAFDIEAPKAIGLVVAAPADAHRLDGLPWRHLADDPPGDGAAAAAPEARALWYAQSEDTTWFRVDLSAAITPEAGVGFNLAVDTDEDQATGSPWWGGNSGFRFDRVATAWVFRTDTGYWGTVGVSEHTAAVAGDYASLASGGLAVAVSDDRRRLFVGIPTGLVDDDGRMRLIAAVGTNTTWNDDLVDEGWVELGGR